MLTTSKDEATTFRLQCRKHHHGRRKAMSAIDKMRKAQKKVSGIEDTRVEQAPAITEAPPTPATPAASGEAPGEPGESPPLSKTKQKAALHNEQNREFNRHVRTEHKRPREERLPHGAAFSVTYNAESMKWSGALVIPGLPAFEDQAGGVFRLLYLLDCKYRKHLHGNAKKEA